MARKIVSHYAAFDNLSGSRDLVFYYAAGGADSLQGIPVEEADYLVDLMRNERPITYDHERRRLSTGSTEPVGEAEESPDLDDWLDTHLMVAHSITWESSTGSHPWPAWSSSWKSQLRSAFRAAWNRGSISVPSVPVNQATPADDEHATTVLSSEDAWAYFKASVAQSLAIELGQQVGWSIQSYSAQELAQLFDSREMFRRSTSPSGYRLEALKGRVVPAPPRRTYQFLAANDLISHSRLDTLGRVLGWCREHLVHFTGGTETANMEDQWQYRGYPPLTRVLDGTVQTSRPEFGTRHRTAGCWGTTGVLRVLLRAINIPVKLVTHAGHAIPWFMADGRYLTHGDDPYNQLTRSTPPYPARELLIDQAKFDTWFGPGLTEAQRGNNIGRRPRELAIVHLPSYLLHRHCGDLAAGRSHADSQVFETLSRNYTVAQLEAENLWDRMDAKIASFGGCAHVP